MTKNNSFFIRLFDKSVLAHPGIVIICLILFVAFLGYKSKDFKLDASAETLVLENDKDLKFFRTMISRYGTEDFLVITYAPKGDLFSDKTLKHLGKLQKELIQLKYISGVLSVLNVPLLESSQLPMEQLINNIPTLESSTLDPMLVKEEFKNSPLYQNLLVSPDLKTTALQVTFAPDDAHTDLLNRRNYFRGLQTDRELTVEETNEFQKVQKEFKAHRDMARDQRHEDIAEVRAIMDKYRDEADLFLGGVSMIADDLISFIKNDLKIFGLGVLFFLIITLSIIFKRFRWIIIPMFCCSFAAISMVGLLGTFGWEVTVISSNFISLQLIITMAITIHLIVRYRELYDQYPDADQRFLVLETVRMMIRPCVYAALTTIAGFGSLLFCEILPVITFGWMMSAGIIVSLCIVFLLFPTVLLLMGKGKPEPAKNAHFTFTAVLARFTEARGTLIVILSAILLVVSAVGISRLMVENSFINYFKDTTEIYQGMKTIDQTLGGTTPLDVIIDIEAPEELNLSEESATTSNDSENLDDLGEFDEEFDEMDKEDKYWFTTDKMVLVKQVHDYLDSLDHTGKVLSLGTMMKIAERFNDDKPLDNLQLALIYEELPDRFKKLVLNPYVSVENSQVRFSIRVKDSEKSLKRDELLKRIQRELTGKLALKPENVHLTGLLVLYNNMLQSLFDSQILTLGIVVVALMVMFLILFRSLKIALIAIFPNLLAVGSVLGFMGWVGIPLDMMTITIAAISVGIAVDDTIHYIHRFIHEFAEDRNYLRAMYRSHSSIGYAMYYTSITIIIGFSILTLSNFIPSIYFGLLTSVAMLIALIASLTLLPQLIVVLKPLGPEAEGE